MTDQWKQLFSEWNILRTKKESGGRLTIEEASRFAWLDERFGNANPVERIQVDASEELGPKTVTTQDHYATEVSEQLLKDAERYKAKKAWEKDRPEERHSVFEARDVRAGKKTQQQAGLSSFAIEVTDDMLEGEIGLSRPESELGQPPQDPWERKSGIDIDDETASLLDQAPQDSENPFALHLPSELTQGFETHQPTDPDDPVTELSARSFEANLPDEDQPVDLDRFSDSFASFSTQPDDSFGSKTTHVIEDDDFPTAFESFDPGRPENSNQANLESGAGINFDLMQQAIQAENHQAPQSAYAPNQEPEEEVIEIRRLSDLPPANAAPMAPYPRPNLSQEKLDIDSFWNAATESKPSASESIPDYALEELPTEERELDLLAPNKSILDQNPQGLDLLDNLFETKASPSILPPLSSPNAALDIDKGPSNLDLGPRNVTVHFLDGFNKRGIVTNLDPEADLLHLDPLPGSSDKPEDLLSVCLKTIFVMRSPNLPAKNANGTEIQVTLVDNRKLMGLSPDYQAKKSAFTLFPKPARGNIERIVVFSAAVKKIDRLG